jgi:hypothetical protein
VTEATSPPDDNDGQDGESGQVAGMTVIASTSTSTPTAIPTHCRSGAARGGSNPMALTTRPRVWTSSYNPAPGYRVGSSLLPCRPRSHWSSSASSEDGGRRASAFVREGVVVGVVRHDGFGPPSYTRDVRRTDPSWARAFGSGPIGRKFRRRTLFRGMSVSRPRGAGSRRRRWRPHPERRRGSRGSRRDRT